MPQPIIQQLIIPAVLTILSAVMGYVVWLMQQQRADVKEAARERKENAKKSEARMKAMEVGLMLILKEQLSDYHKRFCVNGESMTADDYENVADTYKAYHALGGNGTGTKMFEEIKEIHLS